MSDIVAARVVQKQLDAARRDCVRSIGVRASEVIAGAYHELKHVTHVLVVMDAETGLEHISGDAATVEELQAAHDLICRLIRARTP